MKFMLFPELAQLSQALSHSSQECTVHTRIEAYSCKPIKKDKKLSKVMENNFQEVKAEIEQSVGSPGEDDDAYYASPFGLLNKPQSRKTLYLLIQLLNLAFPDYDFSEAKADHFAKEQNGSSVLQSLSSTFQDVRTKSGPRLVFAPRSYAAYPPTSPEMFLGSSPTSSSVPKLASFLRSGSPPSPGSLPRSLSPISSAHHLTSGIHPTLFQILDKVISLNQCDVYSYQPDMDSDPHNDDSDSDVTTEATTEVSEEYDDDLLGFDDFTYGSPPKNGTAINRAPYGSWDDEEAFSASPDANGRPRAVRRKSLGGLLWSSHWFFHNKKLKRILFITIWAKRRNTWDEPDMRERFTGWLGGVGAGARALGLNTQTK